MTGLYGFYRGRCEATTRRGIGCQRERLSSSPFCAQHRSMNPHQGTIRMTETKTVEVMQAKLFRPIIGIENRTPQEVFDILCDRFRHRLASQSLSTDEEVTSALSDVAAERRRQVEGEGWTPEHDDQHDDGELLAAALCYGQSALGAASQPPFKLDNPPGLWPWDAAWWKPANPRRDLVRAAALILAEIERIDRAALQSKDTPSHG